MPFLDDATQMITDAVRFLLVVAGLAAVGGVAMVAIHKLLSPIPILNSMEQKNPEAMNKVIMGIVILAVLSGGGFAWLQSLGEGF